MIVSKCFVVLGLMSDEGMISHACNVVISSHMLGIRPEGEILPMVS